MIVERGREAELVIGWLEDGVALVEHGFDDERSARTTSCSPSPIVSLLPGWFVAVLPTGTGKRRGSTIESEMPMRLTNQSSPKAGSSAFSTLLPL